MPSGVTRTIRIDKDLDETLQRIAKDNRVTVNAIVNQSIRKYVDWDRHAERFGMMDVRPAILASLMEKQTVEEARESGKTAARDSMKPAIEYIFVDVTLQNSIEFLRRFSKYGGRFEFEETVDGRKHAILLKHPLGMKWSAYYEGILKHLFEEELGIKVRMSVTPEACVATFEV